MLAGSASLSVSGWHIGGLPGGAWYHPVALLLGLPANALIAAADLGERRHQKLYPWCPYCYWDNGSEQEPAPGPGPEGDRVPSPAG